MTGVKIAEGIMIGFRYALCAMPSAIFEGYYGTDGPSF
jgi:hypothetical protein